MLGAAPSPATTGPVSFETLPDDLPPARSISSFIRLRERSARGPVIAPVTTTFIWADGPAAPSPPSLPLPGRAERARDARTGGRVDAAPGRAVDERAVHRLGLLRGECLAGAGQRQQSVGERHLDRVRAVLGARGARRRVARLGEGCAALPGAHPPPPVEARIALTRVAPVCPM
ncbi:hypothetical protein GCM10010236_25620 [Streptomyces eurythermus]|nr:hypothetical protein GCM10010236_25620 [Streptomyces eurythermus]